MEAVLNIMKRFFWTISLAVGALAAAGEPQQRLDFRIYHLGVAGKPEWEDLADAPDGPDLSLTIPAEANDSECTLLLWQDNVKQSWEVRLNDRRLGTLPLYEVPVLSVFTIAPGGLKAGENILRIIPPKEVDDIRVGLVRVDRRPLNAILSQCSLDVEVTEPAAGGLPCRITVVDQAYGARAPLQAGPGQKLAVRPGCVYAAGGKARLLLAPGRYRVHAGRGFEYSVDSREVELRPGDSKSVSLEIRREVPTPGLVACDTHMHTLHYSGHGDAGLEERALTLAGEGIELPVATEHNLHGGYADAAVSAGVRDRFTPVLGCEVTTKTGHFNIFPVEPGSRVADFNLADWPRLMESMRSVPGVRVVILNHPRNNHSDFVPFAEANFNSVTGENRRGAEFTFDALEILNSSALRTDDFQVFRDWFALLNYGYRVTGVGSSDCHEVSRFTVGQGRTYLEVPDAAPGRIDVEAACRALREGRALVSLGLLARISVNGRYGPGDLVPGKGDLEVEVSVLGPSWTRAERVELYSNGVKIRDEAVAGAAGGEKARLRWTMPRPAYDLHLVAIAHGPGVRELYWPLSRPYQPTSPAWNPRVIGITNPVRVDGDGDGVWTSPRAFADRLVRLHGNEPTALLAALSRGDEAIAAQAASLLHARGKDVRGEPWASAPEPVRRGFTAYVATLR